MVIISPSAKISKHADIEASVKGTKIIIGNHAFIDSFVKIKPAGGSGDIFIGNKCYINSGTVIYSGNGVFLGEGVMIAANCTIAPVNHGYLKKNIPILEQGFLESKGGIHIDDDVWIGANCIVLDGAKIGKGVVVGAGSVVRGSLQPYGVYAGNPAKKIGARF